MDLGFAEAVTSAFGFLAEWGFRCVGTEPTRVRYESRCAYLTVYHGRTSKELNVELGLFPQRTTGGSMQASPLDMSRTDEDLPEFVIGSQREQGAFTIWEVARFGGAPDVDEHTFLQASTAERVRRWVPRLAELTKRYAEPIRFCDELFFRELSDWRSADSVRQGKERELNDVRRRVADAWRRRAYREVVEAFDPVRDELTPAEQLKLEYAKKRLS